MNGDSAQRVYILLSTFNGERHLPELLESLVAQTRPDLHIQIRDDGSQDTTPEILEAFVESCPTASADFGHNLGPADSFLQLVRRLPDDAAFFGFCDQDDVWDPEKVEVAVEFLNDAGDRPAMYFSRVRIVDENLNLLRLSTIPRKPLSLENALAQNVAQGCTMLVNTAGINVLKSSLPGPGATRMHDWWVYQVISATGEVRYDVHPHLSYRQHVDNVIGYPGGLRRWGRRLARIPRRRGQVTQQARVLRKALAPQLGRRQRGLLDRFIREADSPSLLARARFAASGGVYRQRRIDDAILRLLILLRWV